MCPGAELRFAAVRRQCSEDLDPHLLRDVGCEIGVADKTPDDGVDVRRVLRPEVVQRPLIAFNGALDEDLIHSHWLCFLGHAGVTAGLPPITLLAACWSLAGWFSCWLLVAGGYWNAEHSMTLATMKRRQAAARTQTKPPATSTSNQLTRLS